MSTKHRRPARLSGSRGATTTGRRARNRQARHDAFLAAAIAVVGSDGLDGLTMSRLADEVDCAVGTVYTYFPSKGALVAAVQAGAIERLTRSYLAVSAAAEAALDEAGETDAANRAVTLALLVGRFWAATTETHPREAQLMQVLMTEQREVMSRDEASVVLPAALEHLGHAQAVLERAVAVGALAPGQVWQRVVVWVAAVNGVVQVSRLAGYDVGPLDGVALAGDLNRDLLRAWGAPPDALAAADRHLDELARRGPLAPIVAETERQP